MNITVYLPNGLGKRAKLERFNFSRMLREAVIAELKIRESAGQRLVEYWLHESTNERRVEA